MGLVSCQNSNLVSGKVYNTQNQPLDSVKVLTNGTDIYTYSNSKGYFEINTNGLSDELLFDKSGYKLKFKKIKGNLSDLTITLLPDQ
jgi:hypothetical protein